MVNVRAAVWRILCPGPPAPCLIEQLEERMPFGLLFFWCLLMPITTYDGPSNDTWDSHPAPDAKKRPRRNGAVSR
jgi:hypothetical protein